MKTKVLFLTAALILASCGDKDTKAPAAGTPVPVTIDAVLENGDHGQVLNVEDQKIKINPELYKVRINDQEVEVLSRATEREVLSIKKSAKADANLTANAGTLSMVASKVQMKFDNLKEARTLIESNLSKNMRQKVTKNPALSRVEVQGDATYTLTLEEAKLIPFARRLGTRGTVRALKDTPYMAEEKILMLKKEMEESSRIVYQLLESIDATDAVAEDFEIKTSVTNAGDNYKVIKVAITNEGTQAFAIDYPFSAKTMIAECGKYRRSKNVVTRRLENGIEASLILRNDLFKKCVGERKITGEVRVFDKNINFIKLSY